MAPDRTGAEATPRAGSRGCQRRLLGRDAGPRNHRGRMRVYAYVEPLLHPHLCVPYVFTLTACREGERWTIPRSSERAAGWSDARRWAALPWRRPGSRAAARQGVLCLPDFSTNWEAGLPSGHSTSGSVVLPHVSSSKLHELGKPLGLGSRREPGFPRHRVAAERTRLITTPPGTRCP